MAFSAGVYCVGVACQRVSVREGWDVSGLACERVVPCLWAWGLYIQVRTCGPVCVGVRASTSGPLAVQGSSLSPASALFSPTTTGVHTLLPDALSSVPLRDRHAYPSLLVQ